MYDIWSYPEDVHRHVSQGNAWIGYDVEATDGSIGKIDEATYDAGASYVVVDTGPWIFGKKVLIPAGVIQRIDSTEEIVYLDRTKDQVKASPEFDERTYMEPTYRDQIGTYYGPDGPGYRGL